MNPEWTENEGTAGEVPLSDDILDHLLDPHLLNLDQFPPSPQLLHHFFSSWLSLPPSTPLVRSLIDFVKVNNAVGGSATPISVENNPSPGVETPPQQNIERSPLASSDDVSRGAIPQFYFPGGRPPTDEFRRQCLNRINSFFSDRPQGLEKIEFVRVARAVCRLPFVSFSLFEKIVRDRGPYITRDAFIEYWVNSNILTMDPPSQIFNILKQPGQNYLTQFDFIPVVGEILTFHPGLYFFKKSLADPFTRAYIRTTTIRIFFYINRAQNGRLTLRELKSSDLVTALQHAEAAEDTKETRRYFSYKHFYVIYWKFARLDTDRDEYITNFELIRYEHQALSFKIVDRIFAQVPRKFKSTVKRRMNYEDFVYFFLAEQDKESESSLEYWFKCVDLDGNGVLTNNELGHFYREQFMIMKEILAKDCVPLPGILDRIYDIIEPEARDCITLRDLKRSKNGGDLFDILFNFRKYMVSDKSIGRPRNPKFPVGEEHLWAHLTEFDRYVEVEYPKLLLQNELGYYEEDSDFDSESSEEEEEEGEEGGGGGGGGEEEGGGGGEEEEEDSGSDFDMIL